VTHAQVAVVVDRLQPLGQPGGDLGGLALGRGGAEPGHDLLGDIGEDVVLADQGGDPFNGCHAVESSSGFDKVTTALDA
jgi:hypothetical protein